MKVFFDTNVYVAEALLGETAEALVEATQRANWRIVTNIYVLDEVHRVLAESLGFSVRFAVLTRQRVGRRAGTVEPTTSRHRVPGEPLETVFKFDFKVSLWEGNAPAEPFFSKKIPLDGSAGASPSQFENSLLARLLPCFERWWSMEMVK